MYPGASMVIVGSEKWISGNQTSKHHLVRQFLKLGATIIYVENISMRNIGSGGSKDLNKGKRILQSVFRGTVSPLPNLYCYTPLYFPYHGSFLVRKLNSWLVSAQIRLLAARYRLSDIIYLFFVPTGVLLSGYLGERLSAYYVVDNFAAFDGVESKAVKDYESQAVKNSDHVFATAKTIIDRLAPLRSDINYSPHGVDFEFFSAVQSGNVPIPDDVADLRKPVIGFMGTLAADSVNLELIERLAKRRPGWNFLLLGKAVSDISSLTALDNVRHVPSRPYEQMPAYLNAFDVAIIPFRINDLTRDLNPIKLREYLAAGLPTVATRLPAMEPYEPAVKCVQSDIEWEIAIESFIISPGDSRSRQDAVRQESWENRAKAVADVIKAKN